MLYQDRLHAKILASSPVCVGLDPMLTSLPEGVPRTIEGLKAFCVGIIDAVKSTACCVKPQLAYFERHGWQGMKVFWELCEYAQSQHLIVIADAKRGDIGPTCEAYADAYLGYGLPVDAITLSPYLGSDGIRPFIDRAMKYEKGCYVLVRTSNPSAGELQDLPVGDEALHEHLAQLVESWSLAQLGATISLSCVGAVVGATYPEEMKYLRTLMPHVPFLIPGYGAQGATATDAAFGFLPDGTGAVVSASRSILYASSGDDWQQAATLAVQAMAREMKTALTTKRA